jgi:glycosyltransferase involved in cell wall biosynthesis
LAAGVPVVTTAANGASELIEHGVSGWIVNDPGDTGRMVKGCDLLLQRGVGHFPNPVCTWEESVDTLVRFISHLDRDDGNG